MFSTTLLGLLSIFLSLSANPIINHIKYINNILIQNLDGSFSSKPEDSDLFVASGKESDKLHRIFIDQTSDDVLPNEGFPPDRLDDSILGKVEKKTWFDLNIAGLEINAKNYTNSKAEFIKKFPAVTISILLGTNMWSSSSGWLWEHGKLNWMKPFVEVIQLSQQSFNKQWFYNDAHRDREAVKLVMRQVWEGDVLKINWILSVWYYWTAGSAVKHASLGKFMQDLYSFVPNPAFNGSSITNPDLFSWKTGVAASPIVFNLGTSKVRGLEVMDAGINVAASNNPINESKYKYVPLVHFFASGMRIMGNYLWRVQTMFISSPFSQLVKDTKKGLDKKPIVGRYLQSEKNGNQTWIKYSNLKGKDEITNSNPMSPEIVGMALSGIITTPYVYSMKK